MDRHTELETTAAPAEGTSGRGVPEWLVLLVVFAVGCLLVVSRRPDAVTNPQFHVEDGTWYTQARELGPLWALVTPHRGYLVMLPRIGAWIALLVSLAHAPLVFNLIAAAVQALPAVLLASRRFEHLVPGRAGRLLLAFLYLGMPSTQSTMANLTHAMWYLAPLACMVALAAPPRRPGWKAFDLAAVVLSGLTGPFSIFLTPVLAIAWWLRRRRWTLVLLFAAAATACVQGVSILLAPPQPGGLPPLGVSATVLANIFVKRVVYATLFGTTGAIEVTAGNASLWAHPVVLGVVAVAAAAVVLCALIWGPLELRLFFVYAVSQLGATVAWPAPTTSTLTWWEILQYPGNGNRYFITSVLAFLAACAWMLRATAPPVRLAGAAILGVVLTFGVRLDWREPPLRDCAFGESVERFRRAVVGERVSILIPPNWEMVLTKRASDVDLSQQQAGTREVRVEPVLLESNQMTWVGGVGHGSGEDPFAVYAFPDKGVVLDVRLEYELTTPGGAPAMLQAFWMKSGVNTFGAETRNDTVAVQPGPGVQVTTFRVNDRIDRLRIDPDTKRCIFRLRAVTLVLPVGA